MARDFSWGDHSDFTPGWFMIAKLFTALLLSLVLVFPL
jgi:hypothetical protein